MTPEKWQKLSLEEQMGNIGSEFNRMVSLNKKGDQKNKNRAETRILELIDLTISDKRWQARLSELTRMREMVCEISRKSNTSQASLLNYFLHFALKARMQT